MSTLSFILVDALPVKDVIEYRMGGRNLRDIYTLKIRSRKKKTVCKLITLNVVLETGSPFFPS